MVDVFEEVDERLRSDHYARLAQRVLPWALAFAAIVAAVTAAAWGYQSYRDHGAQQASQAYADGEQALAQGDTKTAFSKFAQAEKAPVAIYRSLAQMQEGAIRLNAGDTAQAVSYFDAAAKDAPDQAIGDAARLKSALALLDTASLADLEARLTPIAAPTSPVHALAREALAMARLKAGKVDEAKSDLRLLVNGLDTPDDVRQRAQAVQVLVEDGSISSLAPTVKAATALPIPPPSPPQQMQGPGAGQ